MYINDVVEGGIKSHSSLPCDGPCVKTGGGICLYDGARRHSQTLSLLEWEMEFIVRKCSPEMGIKTSHGEV